MRNINVIVNIPKKTVANHTSTNQFNKDLTNKEVVQKDVSKEKDLQEIVVNKFPRIKKSYVHVEKIQPSFNLENEISKIKISLPFSEILRNS